MRDNYYDTAQICLNGHIRIVFSISSIVVILTTVASQSYFYHVQRDGRATERANRDQSKE